MRTQYHSNNTPSHPQAAPLLPPLYIIFPFYISTILLRKHEPDHNIASQLVLLYVRSAPLSTIASGDGSGAPPPLHLKQATSSDYGPRTKLRKEKSNLYDTPSQQIISYQTQTKNMCYLCYQSRKEAQYPYSKLSNMLGANIIRSNLQ